MTNSLALQRLFMAVNGGCRPGTAVAHTRRKRTLERNVILRLTGFNCEFTLSAVNNATAGYRLFLAPT